MVTKKRRITLDCFNDSQNEIKDNILDKLWWCLDERCDSIKHNFTALEANELFLTIAVVFAREVFCRVGQMIMEPNNYEGFLSMMCDRLKDECRKRIHEGMDKELH